MNKWLKLGIGVARVMIPAVAKVETISRSLPSLKGQQKQDAVIELVKASVLASESIADRDLLNDPEVEKATRGIVDAVVAFQNVLVRKQAA